VGGWDIVVFWKRTNRGMESGDKGSDTGMDTTRSSSHTISYTGLGRVMKTSHIYGQLFHWDDARVTTGVTGAILKLRMTGYGYVPSPLPRAVRFSERTPHRLRFKIHVFEYLNDAGVGSLNAVHVHIHYDFRHVLELCTSPTT
jgi:hypothetical protein